MKQVLAAALLVIGTAACSGADNMDLGLGSDASVAPDGGAAAPDATLPDAGGCVPFDTADCAGKCGKLVGRCGNVITCTACPGALTCGAGGPNLCGTGTCTPSCTGKACGASDGCASVCTDGCACGPSTCNGCCAGGACVAGTGADACGKGGGACSPCGAAATCSAGACVPTSTASRVLLFGGGSGTGVLGDTWIWDGGAWTKRNVAGPPARQYHAMAALGGKVVLFGGFDGTNRLSDTWEWDGSAWTKRAVSGPDPRRRMAMAPLGNKLVLFGGSSVDGDGGVVDPSDIWEWDGASWTHTTPTGGPGGLVGHRMATLGAQLLLFGGDIGGFSSGPGATWTWDGTAWGGGTSSAGPDGRTDESLATLGSRVVLFGGASANVFGGAAHEADTWEWSAGAWTQRPIPGPPGRNGHAAATLGSKVVLFGGEIAGADGGTALANDTWEYDGTAWTQRAVIGPAARDTSAMASY
jgi:Kelch motif